MSDFFCTEAKDMYYKELSDRVRHYKETEKGVDDMCDILDEMKNEARNEGIANNQIETAQKMLKAGKLSYEDIAEYSGLSLEKVRELAGNKSA
jgi:predicted transposase/invertase (TIGR01784 family)